MTQADEPLRAFMNKPINHFSCFNLLLQHSSYLGGCCYFIIHIFLRFCVKLALCVIICNGFLAKKQEISYFCTVRTDKLIVEPFKIRKV